MKKSPIFFLWVVGLLLAQAAYSQIINPSFESKTSGWSLDSSWSVQTTNSIGINGTPDGTNFIYSYVGSVTNVLSQSFTVASNYNYYVSLFRAHQNGFALPAAQVRVDGVVIANFGGAYNDSGSYYLSGNFYLVSGSHTLSVAVYDDDGGGWKRYAVLDNIQVCSTNIPLFSLVVNNGDGSTNTAQGTIIPISANAVPGKHFVAWVGDLNYVSDRFAASTFVSLPTHAITLTAYYLSDSEPTNWIDATDIGAKNDAINFYGLATSNSVVIGTPIIWDTNGTIGKVIEVFRTGPWTYWNNNPKQGVFCTNQDTICLITNVTDGTNLWISIPQGWTSNTLCTVGSYNRVSIQTAIDLATYWVNSGSTTNATIYFPDGKYLVVNDTVLNANYICQNIVDCGPPALTVTAGGITFLGQSTNTVWLGNGAGMEHRLWNGSDPNNTWPYGASGAFVAPRGGIIQQAGPIAHNELPLIFQNIAFDGGVQNGYLDNYRYWIILPGNGDGWDTSHHAFAQNNPHGTPGDPNAQMDQLTLFTNCIFQHWRGETMITTTGVGGTNTFNDIANCTFYDGCASAINLYYGQHIHGCTFDRFDKVEEYYQGNASLPSVFENNTVYSIGSVAWSIVGSLNAYPSRAYTFSNNYFAGPFYSTCIHFAPAANVTISSNVFNNIYTTAIEFSGTGLQPSDGTQSIIHDINILNNYSSSGSTLVMDGYPVSDVLISNNVNFNIAVEAGYKTNILAVYNHGGVFAAGGGAGVDKGPNQGSYPYDSTNNDYSPLSWDGGVYWQAFQTTNKFNLISYSNGRTHSILNNTLPFALDDRYPNLMPTKYGPVVMTVANNSSGTATVYQSLAQGSRAMTIAQGGTAFFYWAGPGWSTNLVSKKLAPPAGLRVVQ